jgi:hypothetical protein
MKVVKSMKMYWSGAVTHRGEPKNTHSILVSKPGGEENSSNI